MKMVSCQIWNINKEIEIIKQKQVEILELRGTVGTMKNPLEELTINSAFEQARERISKLEDRSL